MKKRSKYKPKGVRLDNMSWCIAGMRTVGALPTAGVGIKLKNREALDELLRGVATREHMDVLIAAYNMAEALYFVNKDLGSDWKQEIREAQDALLTLVRRCADRDVFATNSTERAALNIAMDIHDAQLDACTVMEMEKGLEMVNNIVRNKRARLILETA